MRTTVKTLLVFVLLALTYSLSSKAVNFTGMVDKAAAACEVSASSSLGNASSDNVANHTKGLFTNTKFMWATDAELGYKPISETYSLNHYRLRRGVETTSFLKDIFLILSYHQNLLVLDQSKLYYSDKDPHYASFSSEYYIYTLRRIII